MLQQGPEKKAGCSAKAGQFAQDLTADLATLIRATLTPTEWDAVRECDGAHVLGTWPEKREHRAMESGVGARKMQQSPGVSPGVSLEARSENPWGWSKRSGSGSR